MVWLQVKWIRGAVGTSAECVPRMSLPKRFSVIRSPSSNPARTGAMRSSPLAGMSSRSLDYQVRPPGASMANSLRRHQAQRKLVPSSQTHLDAEVGADKAFEETEVRGGRARRVMIGINHFGPHGAHEIRSGRRVHREWKVHRHKRDIDI